jgi:hypothetical protein
MTYAMPDYYDTRRREDHKSFYCPSGHLQSYHGESEAEKLRKQLAQAQTAIEHKDARIADVVRQRESANMQCRAFKGVATRIKTRVAHGVCPCCNRTFKQLAAHMASKHPGYAPSEKEANA